MIRLRAQQQASLGEESLVLRLRAFLHDTFPESRAQPNAEMNQALHEQLRRARGYGLLTERHASIYVITAWLLGERFDEEHRAAAEILTADADPDIKAQLLEDWTLLLLKTLEG